MSRLVRYVLRIGDALMCHGRYLAAPTVDRSAADALYQWAAWELETGASALVGHSDMAAAPAGDDPSCPLERTRSGGAGNDGQRTHRWIGTTSASRAGDLVCCSCSTSSHRAAASGALTRASSCVRPCDHRPLSAGTPGAMNRAPTDGYDDRKLRRRSVPMLSKAIRPWGGRRRRSSVVAMRATKP